MPSVPTPSKAGIIESSTGSSHIPSSVRADGSQRKEIRIRPGYKPPEDVEVYKNRTAYAWKSRGTGGVPGAEGLKESGAKDAGKGKNAKRREARKRAKENGDEGGGEEQGEQGEHGDGEVDNENPETEKEKKARNLRKKLKQANELKEKREGGAALLPEQFAKVIKIQELIRELDCLGFDAGGAPKAKSVALDEVEAVRDDKE